MTKIMKKLSLLVLSAVLASNCLAGPVSYTPKAAQPVQPPLPDVSDCWKPGAAIGIFGGGMIPRNLSDGCGCEDDHRAKGLGGGALLEYFFTRNFGFQASYGAYAPSPVNHVYEGDFIVRFPISSCNLAPYIMAGGGGVADGTNLGMWDVGLGLEARFESLGCMGIFVDGSYHFVTDNRERDFTLVRVGVKLHL
jgi:hypothetical protein